MTPKEKALQLVEKYLCVDETYNVDLFCDECGISNDAAKYCALIAVNEVLKSQNNIYGVNNRATTFYLEVKHELEKL
jgi:hypothetical protein